MEPRKSVSKAEKVFQGRAISCSFSSVFHLRKAGMKEADFQLVTRIFKVGILIPLGAFGLLAGGKFCWDRLPRDNTQNVF
mmetsp:Transcript_20173/g.32601  ORF Transcript_20173/g.32601 Transcript_20173/m.32601 type:complete len:80 (+) Transcript_20173:118-357(+)